MNLSPLLDEDEDSKEVHNITVSRNSLQQQTLACKQDPVAQNNSSNRVTCKELQELCCEGALLEYEEGNVACGVFYQKRSHKCLAELLQARKEDGK